MNETTDAIAIFGPLWRRKWLILAVGIVVGVAAYFYYRHATRVFQATTQVYLGAAAEEQAPGEKTTGGGKNPANSVANQSQIINSIVAEKVRQRLRHEGKAKELRGSKIKAQGTEKSEFITITTESHTAVGAAELANLTAQTYVRRQHATHARTIEKAIAITRRQLRRIEASSVPKVSTKPSGEAKAGESAGGKGAEGKAGEEAKGGSKAGESTSSTPSTASILQAANLSGKINQLESSLAVAGAQQIKPAKPAT
ncbi:MAG TPA: Wzz/FepE/Etk N-terminal domain-containing protein, partial [Solirubrobacteraceae bacterium]|nr:Wzz/FepE/Etk N-terminal domain-containing protein [Solirubrobacteraceae bacterium]